MNFSRILFWKFGAFELKTMLGKAMFRVVVAYYHPGVAAYVQFISEIVYSPKIAVLLSPLDVALKNVET